MLALTNQVDEKNRWMTKLDEENCRCIPYSDMNHQGIQAMKFFDWGHPYEIKPYETKLPEIVTQEGKVMGTGVQISTNASRSASNK